MRPNLFPTLLLLLTLLPSLLFSQNEPDIGAPQVTYYNDTLQIVYTINNCQPGNLYSIDLKVFSSDGKEVRLSSLSGDIGKNITCGDENMIYWDLAKDNFQVNDDIEIEILAKLTSFEKPPRKAAINAIPDLSRGKIVANSLIFPGLGQKKVKGRNSPLILGVSGYLFASASVVFAIETGNKYDQYLNETNGLVRVKTWSRVEDNYEMAKITAYTAAGIWAVNLIWAAFVPTEHNKPVAIGVLPIETGGVGVYARWNF